MTKLSWRLVYILCAALVLFFSVLQLLLIFRITAKWGIPDLMFATGDDALTQFVQVRVGRGVM
jgi:glycopeptide antibiotics resistance protein